LPNNKAKNSPLPGLVWDISSEVILLGGEYLCGLGWAGSDHRITTFNTHSSHPIIQGVSRGVSKNLTLKHGLLL